jgi:3-phenylpropionate/trans-cinnamate dioxygenase ferredoxin subunit
VHHLKLKGESKMDYTKVADKNELMPNTMKLVIVGDKEVLLANLGGAYYAIANKCTHLGGSLVKGTLEGGIVTCPKHKAQFDVKTGEALAEAKIGFIKMKVKDEASYEVKIDGDNILIGLP